MRKILFIFVIILINITSYARLMYYNECSENSLLTEYYKNLLLSDKVKVDKNKVSSLEVYSKKVNSNLCMYYIDTKYLGLNMQSDNLYMFVDTKSQYIYPSVVDLKNNIELKSYMQTEIENYDVDFTKGINILNNNSKNNIALFLSLECPYCAYLYQFIISYSDFAVNQKLTFNSNIYLFLSSKDNKKVEFFKQVADKNPKLFIDLLYKYYSEKNLQKSVADIKSEFNAELKDIQFSSTDIAAMQNEFNKISINAVPLTVINKKLITGANIGLITYIIENQRIANFKNIANEMREYQEKQDKQQQKNK